MAYITIVKGDDTDFLDNQYIVVNFNTDLELNGFQAVFNIDNIELTYPDLSAKYIEIVLSKEVTATLKKGKTYGTLKIIDPENRIRTVTSVIPFNVVTKVLNSSQISKQSIQLNVGINKNEFNVDMNIVGLSKRVAENYLTQMKQYDAKLTEKIQTVKNLEASLKILNASCQASANNAETSANSANQSAQNLDEVLSHINETRASVSLDNINEDAKKVIQKNSVCAFEIGDIGFTQMAVDETKGKRRILNGQVIIQEQYPQFTQIIKNSAALNSDLICSEEDWQTALTMSANGICYKFVIDDEAGTIRLPKYPEYLDLSINGDKNVSIAGNGNAISVWDGSRDYALDLNYTAASTARGLFPDSSKRSGKAGDAHGGVWSDFPSNVLVGFSKDPSRTGLTGSVLITSEQIKGQYFIQVATGTETEENIVNKIELNNPFSLLDYKYSEYEINNLSWLKSAGQWNSKTVHPAVYELLLKIYNGTETKTGVNVKLSTESYTNSDFALNTTDETFRLPLEVLLTDNGSLYFYVGETVQNVNLINAGRIEEKLADALAKPHIIETYQNYYSWYRVWSDGWCEQGATAQVANGIEGYAVTLLKPLTTYSVQLTMQSNAYSTTGWGVSSLTSTGFKIFNSQSNTRGCAWVAYGWLA